MKGARVIFPTPGQATLEEVEIDTDHLAPHEMVLRAHRTLISPGTELARWQGKLGMHRDDPDPFPITRVGYAAVGTVVASGSETGTWPGDRVYTMGPHAMERRHERG